MSKKYEKGIAKVGPRQYEVLVTRRDRRQGGKRVSRRRTVYGSRRQAKAVKRELESELDQFLSGQTLDELTLTGFVQQWLEARSAELRKSTLAKYVNDLSKHILPVLGHRNLSELRPRDIVTFLAQDQGAPNSKKNRLTLLRVLAKDAIAEGYIDRDFCLRVSVKVPAVYTEDEPNLLDTSQFQKLIRAIPRYWLDVACMLGLTGLRWGEVSAFHWRDIDFDNAVARVRWNNWKGTLTEPKTERSRRLIPLPDTLVAVLRQRWERMKDAKHPGLRRGLVFPTLTGGLHKGTPLNRVLRQACKVSGITIRFTPHGLRRTWNDIARRVADGVVVRSMLGHASEAMTDHYSFVALRERRSTSDVVAGHLIGADTSEPSLVDKTVDADVETSASTDHKPE